MESKEDSEVIYLCNGDARWMGNARMGVRIKKQYTLGRLNVKFSALALQSHRADNRVPLNRRLWVWRF